MYFSIYFLSFILKILLFNNIIYVHANGKLIPSLRILGGRLAEVRRFPFMVSIQYRWPDFDDEVIVMPICGGSILRNKWILTAAHCTIDLNDLYVKAGAIDAEENTELYAQVVSIKKAYTHPLFINADNLSLSSCLLPVLEYILHFSRGGINGFDIALLELTEELQFNEFVQPIYLPPENYMPTGYGDIIGWGTTDPTAQLSSQKLLQAHVKLMPIEECKKIYEQVTINHICPGEIGKSSCAGDSGGPFIQRIRGRKTVVGVTSFGKRPCGKTPEAYVRVSAYVNNFILPTMEKNS